MTTWISSLLAVPWRALSSSAESFRNPTWARDHRPNELCTLLLKPHTNILFYYSNARSAWSRRMSMLNNMKTMAKLHQVLESCLWLPCTWTYKHTHSSTWQFWRLIMSQRESSASLVAQTVKNLSAVPKTRVQSLHQEDPLEKGMATHSRIFAWRSSRIEDPGGLQSIGSQRVGHD